MDGKTLPDRLYNKRKQFKKSFALIILSGVMTGTVEALPCVGEFYEREIESAISQWRSFVALLSSPSIHVLHAGDDLPMRAMTMEVHNKSDDNLSPSRARLEAGEKSMLRKHRTRFHFRSRPPAASHLGISVLDAG